MTGGTLTGASGLTTDPFGAASELPHFEQKTASSLFLDPHEGHCLANAPRAILLLFRNLRIPIVAIATAATSPIRAAAYVIVSAEISNGVTNWLAAPTGMLVLYRVTIAVVNSPCRNIVSMSTPVTLSYHERSSSDSTTKQSNRP